jgi:type I site-specific restriction-modification system R (restriction) subunit
MPGLLSSNEHFHGWLAGGVQCIWQNDGETRGGKVKLLDYENPEKNDWLVANQFTVQATKSGSYPTRRPDAVVFLNGLPLAVIELKNPADENADVWAAFNQLQAYKLDIPDLFRTNELLIVSDNTYARMGSLTADKERFSAWRTIDGVTLDPLGKLRELETLVRGVFAKPFLLDYLRHFIVFEDDGGLQKKIAAYHQFHAVRAVVEQVHKASGPGGNGKGGVVWHTQGAGKSLEMTCLAGKLMADPQMKNPTLVLITDRNDLDGQLFGTFANTKDLLIESPVQVESRPDLREKLNNRPSGGIMVVCMSRAVCVLLYDAIVKLRPDWHDSDPEMGAIKIVMTGSASDKPALKPHIYSKQTKKRLEKRFKDPKDQLRMVLVRDMWLTGFDVPCLTTMYVDKPMRDHNLMQAIARVNRVFKDKPGGLIVDYIGIANELKRALKTYTASHGRGKPTIDSREAYSILVEKIEVARGILYGVDYSDYRTKALKLLPIAANHVLGLENGKKRFCDCVLAISQAYSLCCTLDEAKEYTDEIAFLQAVRAVLVKGDPRKSLNDDAKEYALRQIISKAVVSSEVIDIFSAAGLNRPDVSILSDEFLDDVRRMKEKNLAVELLERLLKGDIQSRFATNVVQNLKFSALLHSSLQRYRARAIETAQVIEELIEMAKRFKEAAERGEQLGLKPEEIAFYDALASNEASVRELGDETLKKIALELTEKLRRSVTVDWSVRESVRARLRIMVKTILKKYKYPPDKQDEATETVLKQAEVLSAAWATA